MHARVTTDVTLAVHGSYMCMAGTDRWWIYASAPEALSNSSP